MEWRKSTYRSTDGGQCVEVGKDGVILVRGNAAAYWQTFVTGLK